MKVWQIMALVDGKDYEDEFSELGEYEEIKELLSFYLPLEEPVEIGFRTYTHYCYTMDGTRAIARLTDWQ